MRITRPGGPARLLHAVLPEMSTKKNFCHFTRVQDDYLIQLVAAQPVIYDPNHQLYKDLTVKDNVWKEISSSIHKTVEECKIRWRSIRDLYNRKKKEILKNPNSVKAIKWEYMDQLGFLDRTSHKKQKTEEEAEPYQDIEKDERNFEEDILLEEFENCEEDCNPIEPEIKIMPKRRKRKLLYQNDFYERYGFEKDAVSLFFASMAQTVMTFPPALAAEAKERVCRIITSLEYRAHVKNEQSDAWSVEGQSPIQENP